MAYGSPDGESYAMLAERIRPWLDALAEDMIVVSHGGVARVLLHLRAGFTRQDAATQDIWQGRVLLIADGAPTGLDPVRFHLTSN
jgi:probable phosphoglycerate mutase